MRHHLVSVQWEGTVWHARRRCEIPWYAVEIEVLHWQIEVALGFKCLTITSAGSKIHPKQQLHIISAVWSWTVLFRFVYKWIGFSWSYKSPRASSLIYDVTLSGVAPIATNFVHNRTLWHWPLWIQEYEFVNTVMLISEILSCPKNLYYFVLP